MLPSGTRYGPSAAPDTVRQWPAEAGPGPVVLGPLALPRDRQRRAVRARPELAPGALALEARGQPAQLAPAHPRGRLSGGDLPVRYTGRLRPLRMDGVERERLSQEPRLHRQHPGDRRRDARSGAVAGDL